MAAWTILARHGLAKRSTRAQYFALRRALGLEETRELRRRHRASRDAMAHIDPDTDPNGLEAPGLSAEDMVACSQGLERLEAGLSPRLLYVLRRRMMGDGLHEIGGDMGLCRERVRQLEAEALRLVNPLDTPRAAR